MNSSNVTPLNRALNEALAVFEQSAPRGRFDAAAGVLRAATSGAEVGVGLKLVSDRLLEACEHLGSSEIWNGLSALVRATNLKPAPYVTVEAENRASSSSIPSEHAELRRLVNDQVAAIAEIDDAQKVKGVQHAPLLWATADFVDEFHQALDKNLKNLAPLYVDASPAAPVVDDHETILTLKSLLVGVLRKILCQRTDESIVDAAARSGLGAREDIDGGSIRDALTEAIVGLNVLSFNALYLGSEGCKEDSDELIDFVSYYPEMFRLGDESQGVEVPIDTLGDGSGRLGRTDVAIAVERMLSIVAMVGVLRPGCPGLLAPLLFSGLVLPPLRSAAAYELPDRYMGSAGRRCKDEVSNAAMLSKFLVRKSEAALIAESLLPVLGKATWLSGFHEPLLRTMGLASAEGLTIDEEYRLQNQVAWIRHEDDASDGLFAAMQDAGLWSTTEIFFDRVRRAPRVGERLMDESFSFSNSKTLGFWWLMSELDWAGEDGKDVPAFFAIQHAFDQDRFEGQFSENEGYRNECYWWAIKRCIKEGLYTTAARMFEFWVVTTRFERGDWVGGKEPFEMVERCRYFVTRLVKRVDSARLVKALDVAEQVHASFSGFGAEEEDYVLQELGALRHWIRRDEASRTQPRASVRMVRNYYEHRLLVQSGGKSSLWPEVVRRKFEQIENERDFSLGNRGKEDLSTKIDLPWVVSFHKMIEAPIRQHLQFLFDEGNRELVEEVTRKKVTNRFEMFVVLRLMERLAERPGRCPHLEGQLLEKGVDIRSAKTLLREIKDVSHFRNEQAHDYITRFNADSHRDWVLKNFHRLSEVFGIRDEDFEEVLG